MKKHILALFLAVVLCLTPFAVSAGDLLYGDANEDGKINLKDVLTERKYLSGESIKLSKTLGDCNGDGTVNMKDVLILRQYLVGILKKIDGKAPVYTKKSLRSIYRYDEDGNNFEINFYTYNKNGCLTLMTDRLPDNTLLWKREYTYDSKQREILRVYTDVSSASKVTSAASYNAAGRLAAVVRTDEDGDTIRRVEYDYNEAGLRMVERSFDSDGKADGKVLYSYDDKKRLVKEETVADDGFSYGYATYTYNKAGNTEKIKRYGADGDIVGDEVFEYDAAGNLKSHLYNDADGLLDARVDYTYNTSYLLAYPIPYNFTEDYAPFKMVYAQKNPPISATCVDWKGNLLWQQKYNYLDVE